MIFSKENKKAKELDKLIEKKQLKNSKEFAGLSNTLDILQFLKEQTPEIELKPIYFAEKQSKKLNLVPKLAFSMAVVLIVFGILSFLPVKEKKLSGLNQKAIAKELEIINQNSPIKNLEINQKVKRAISPSKNLEGLQIDAIQKESNSLKLDLQKKQEINDLLNNL